MRRVPLISLVLAPLVIATACGSSSAAPKPNQNGTAALHSLLERGSAAEKRIGTVRYDMLETLSGPQGQGQIGENTVARLAPPAVETTSTSNLSGQNTTVHVIEVGKQVYLEGGAFSKLVPSGKRWLRTSSAKFSTAVGVPNQSSQLISELRASSRLTDLGASSANGQAATEYRFVFDVGSMTAKAAKQSILGQLSSVLKGISMPIEIWVNKQGLVLREQSQFTYRGYTVHILGNATYGVPVHVVAPPPAQVATHAVEPGSTGGTTGSNL